MSPACDRHPHSPEIYIFLPNSRHRGLLRNNVDSLHLGIRHHHLLRATIDAWEGSKCFNYTRYYVVLTISHFCNWRSTNTCNQTPSILWEFVCVGWGAGFSTQSQGHRHKLTKRNQQRKYRRKSNSCRLLAGGASGKESLSPPPPWFAKLNSHSHCQMKL